MKGAVERNAVYKKLRKQANKRGFAKKRQDAIERALERDRTRRYLAADLPGDTSDGR